MPVAASVALLTATGPPAAAAQKPKRTRSIRVKPANRFGGVELASRLEAARRAEGPRRAVHTGDRVQVGELADLPHSAPHEVE